MYGLFGLVEFVVRVGADERRDDECSVSYPDCSFDKR